MIVLQIIAFAIVMGILYKFVFTKIVAGVAAREERIRKTFEEIEAKQAGLIRELEEYARKIKEIEQAAATRMKEALEEGLKLRKDMEAEAVKRAEGEIARAEALIRIETDQATATLRREAARLAIEQAERMLGKIGTDVQSRLVDRYLKEMEKVGKV